MQICRPIDAEDAMRVSLAAFLDCDVMVPPLPADLPSKSVVITRTGGSRSDMVVDTSMLSIDCRADELADAIDLANEAAGIVAALPGASINALPYANPDPRRPDISRVTFTALATNRAETKEV